MATANLATCRVLGYSILGRLGSFNGDFDADYKANHVGKDIGVLMDEFWASDEGVNWRAKLQIFTQSAAELPIVKQQLETAKGALEVSKQEVLKLRKENTTLVQQNSNWAEEVADLSLTNDGLIKQIQDQTAEIDNLKLELEEAQLPNLVTWSSIWADIKFMFSKKE